MNTILIIEYDHILFYFELQIYVKKYGHSQKRVSHLLNLCDTFLFSLCFGLIYENNNYSLLI